MDLELSAFANLRSGLLTINDFVFASNNRKQVDIRILDFSKAFNKVPHARLVKQLEFYGIQG